MPIGTQPHLILVGDGSPIAVPCLARLGARRSEIRRLQFAEQYLSGSLRRRAYKNIISTPTSISPARLFRSFFSRLDTPCILSCLRAGLLFEGSFCGDESTDGSEFAAGVGACGGQPGSSAWAWRSLTAHQPCGTRVSPWGEAREYVGR
jgi:hypothetical protein